MQYGSFEVNSEIIKTATGWNICDEELSQIAERILSLEKSTNVLAGLGRKDDYPPQRFYEPIPDGPFKGISLDKEKITEMLRKHDEFHDWDAETDIPARKTLEDLALVDVADKLEAAGKLA